MRILRLSIFVFAVLFLTETLLAETRKWTDSTGKFSVQAELVEVNDDTVILRRVDGVELRVPIERLSEQDQHYLKSREQAEPLSLLVVNPWDTGDTHSTGSSRLLTSLRLAADGSAPEQVDSVEAFPEFEGRHYFRVERHPLKPYIYVHNIDMQFLTGYMLDARGQLNLLPGCPLDLPEKGIYGAKCDLAVTPPDGGTMYLAYEIDVNDYLPSKLVGYRVNDDGGLVPLGEVLQPTENATTRYNLQFTCGPSIGRIPLCRVS